jgi:hypothetical protein
LERHLRRGNDARDIVQFSAHRIDRFPGPIQKLPAQRRGRAHPRIIGGAAADGEQGMGHAAPPRIGQKQSGAIAGGAQGIALGIGQQLQA